MEDVEHHIKKTRPSRIKPLIKCRPLHHHDGVIRMLISASLLITSGTAMGQESGQQQEPPVEGVAPEIPEIPEIVVTARRHRSPPVRDAVDYYKKYCFEANRLTGQSEAPSDDPDWEMLTPADTARLGKSAPNTIAYGLNDPDTKQTLFLKIERPIRRDKLHEERCILIIVGGDSHASIPNRMSDVLRGRPTQRHVGQREGSPAIPGWKQWLWTGMPGRRSKNWRVDPNNGNSREIRDTWLVVTDLSFYNTYDYIFGDLKTKEADTEKISILAFARIWR